MSDRKYVLITGANKGIGLATVEATLDAAPDTVVLLGSRDRTRGEAAREALIAKQPAWAERVHVVAIDVGDDDSVAAAAATTQKILGEASLYGIVNNAGIGLGVSDMRLVLNVNTHGPRRVCEAFLGLLAPDGRIVNVSSASGPNFVAACSDARQALLTNPEVTRTQLEALMEECLAINAEGGDFAAAGLGNGAAYGLSKACLNAYTMILAREHPERTINACTPGFIETDLTRPFAESRGASPESLGMKTPMEGTRATLRLLLDEPGGSGWYFGSDGERSPIDRYRSPGDPPYRGD